MTVEHLSPAAALVVVDVQAGTLPNARAVTGDDLVSRVASLADAFRASSRPIIHVVSTGTPPGVTEVGGGPRTWPEEFTELDPRLRRTAQEPLLRRAGWSAFTGSELGAALAANGSQTIVVAGLATTFGVESTARDAYDRGLDVIVASDAVSDPDPAGHERTLTRVIPLLGCTATTAEIIALTQKSRADASARCR